MKKINFSQYKFDKIVDHIHFMKLGLKAKVGAEPFEVDTEDLEEADNYQFSYYGEGRPGNVTGIELEDGSIFLNVHNSLRFTDTFHEPERVELRMYHVTPK